MTISTPTLRFPALVPQMVEGSRLRNPALTDALVVASGVALLALSAQLSIRLPFTPVPLTTQTFAVLLIGAAFGSLRGSLAAAIYVILGAAGLPVLAPDAGLMSAGYLAGFVAAAALMGAISERSGRDRRVSTALPLFLLGEAVIFAAGVAWLATFVGLRNAAWLGLVPFLPGEILKVIAASLAWPAARKALRRA